MKRAGVVACAGLLSIVWPDAALARQPASLPVAELAVGAAWTGTMPLGNQSADLTRSGGGAFPVFRTSTDLAPGPGIELHVGRRLAARVAAEASAAWTATEIRTRITGDVEGAAAATATVDLSRLSVEGSALWTLAGNPQGASFFLRAGGGWMREMADGVTLSASGAVGNVGVGVKYWWGSSSPGRGRRFGLRVDGRAVLRWRGVDLGPRTVRAAPVAAANLMIGF